MWEKFKEIVEGWRNDLIPPEHLKSLIENVSEERLAICRACPFDSINAKANGYNSIRIDEHCTKCGCPLSKKTKSLKSECPLDPPKWEKITDQDLSYETNEERDTKDTEGDN